MRVLLVPDTGLKEPRTWTVAPGGTDVPWDGRDRLDVSGFPCPAHGVESSERELTLSHILGKRAHSTEPVRAGMADGGRDGVRERSADACVPVERAQRTGAALHRARRYRISTSASATRPGRSTSTAGGLRTLALDALGYDARTSRSAVQALAVPDPARRRRAALRSACSTTRWRRPRSTSAASTTTITASTATPRSTTAISTTTCSSARASATSCARSPS